MRTSFWRTAALVGCFCLLLGGTSQAQRQREYQIVSDVADDAGSSVVSYNSFEPAGHADDSDNVDPAQFVSGGVGGVGGVGGGRNGLGLGFGVLEQPGQLFFGAEYIYARASFSEALAYIVRDSNNPTGGDEFVEYDFDYQSSYGFYAGYRVPDCGCVIVFDYARYQSDATANVVPEVGQEIFGPYEVNGSQQNSADVDLQSYDLGVARTIPLGGCFCKPCCGDPCCGDDCCGGGCCDDGCCDCGDACGCGSGCGFCPFWDITWSAGLRFAEVGWNRNQQSFGNPTTDRSVITQLNFDGVGGRVGIGGRRYFGRSRFASIYAQGDISLLVGNMSISTITQGLDPTNPQPPAFSHRNSARRVIPVSEIEAGASAHMGNHLTLSAGYFIAAWHDLGMRDQYDFNGQNGGLLQLDHYDDANILGFDGFFARAEVAF